MTALAVLKRIALAASGRGRRAAAPADALVAALDRPGLLTRRVIDTPSPSPAPAPSAARSQRSTGPLRHGSGARALPLCGAPARGLWSSSPATIPHLVDCYRTLWTVSPGKEGLSPGLLSPCKPAVRMTTAFGVEGRCATCVGDWMLSRLVVRLGRPAMGGAVLVWRRMR